MTVVGYLAVNYSPTLWSLPHGKEKKKTMSPENVPVKRHCAGRHQRDNRRPTLKPAVCATVRATRLGRSLLSSAPLLQAGTLSFQMTERKKEKKNHRRRCFTAQHTQRRAQYSFRIRAAKKTLRVLPRISGMSLYTYMDDGDAF